jgi:hypothetical protein
MAGHLGPRRRLAGAQQHRHRPACRGVVNVDRQEAAFPIMTIPERQLLAAMDDVDRLVDVERHRCGRSRIAGTIDVDHDAHHPHQFARRRCVLPAAHRRLAGEADSRAGQLARRQLEAGIMTQHIEVVGVLIATSDRQHPCLQDAGKTMDDPALVPGIGNAAGQTPCNAHPALCLGQQQHAAIRRQPPTIESRGDLLAANGWESKRNSAIVEHGGRGTFCPVSEGRVSNHSLYQISRLCYIRHPGIARLVNNPG